MTRNEMLREIEDLSRLVLALGNYRRKLDEERDELLRHGQDVLAVCKASAVTQLEREIKPHLDRMALLQKRLQENRP